MSGLWINREPELEYLYPQDKTDYEVEKIVYEAIDEENPERGIVYFVKWAGYEFDPDLATSVLSAEEMKYCPYLLYRWKLAGKERVPTAIGSSMTRSMSIVKGVFWSFIEGLEVGEQCMRIAVNIYFQIRFEDSFYFDQLKLNKTNAKVILVLSN